VEHIFTLFDLNGDGVIQYEEFLKGLRGPLSKCRQEMVHAAFRKLDKNNDGHVDVIEVANSYDPRLHPDVINGKKTPDEVLREFLDTFDVGGDIDGRVTVTEFTNYYENVSASIDRDDYFELMMRNTWHLSGGSSWSKNSTNKRVLVKDSKGNEKVVEIEDDIGLSYGDNEGLMKALKKQGVKDIHGISLNWDSENKPKKYSSASAF